MKWGLIAATAAAVALLAGALVLTLGSSSERSAHQATTTSLSPVDVARQVTGTRPAPKRRPSARACQGDAGDSSDPTGDDRSPVRRSARACSTTRRSNDDQAGDTSSDQGGDNQAGDRGGDNQAGDRGSDDQAGDRGDDDQAGDNATNEP